MRIFSSSLVLLVACGSKPEGNDPIDGDGVPADCPDGTYPEGAVEPMALGEVLTPYRWPVAIDRRSGEALALDLADVPCDLDPAFDWGRASALLFVSIPAW